jgi:uncharacterized protein
MTFVLAAPILNPITILVTHQAFGLSDGILFWRARSWRSWSSAP